MKIASNSHPVHHSGAVRTLRSLLHAACHDPRRSRDRYAGAGRRSAGRSSLASKFALDQPLPIRFIAWFGHLLTGDLGRSIQTGRPVLNMVITALIPTMELGLVALLIVSLFIAIPGGVISASQRNSIADYSVSLILPGRPILCPASGLPSCSSCSCRSDCPSFLPPATSPFRRPRRSNPAYRPAGDHAWCRHGSRDHANDPCGDARCLEYRLYPHGQRKGCPARRHLASCSAQCAHSRDHACRACRSANSWAVSSSPKRSLPGRALES